MILETMDYRFSAEQVAFAYEMASALESFIKEHEVADEAVASRKDAEKIAKSNPKKILSLVEEWDSQAETNENNLGQSQTLGYRLVPGYREGSNRFYTADEDIPEKFSDGVSTAVQVVCISCNGEGGDSMTSPCPNCHDNILVLTVKEWDAWGRLQIEADSWTRYGRLVDEVLAWEKFFTANFGAVTVSTREEAEKLPNRAWISYQLRSGDWMLEPIEQADDLLEQDYDGYEYWLSEKPRVKEGEYEFLIESHLSCPECERNYEEDEDWDQDECEVCQGAGIICLHIPDGIGLRSDREILETAIPG